MKNTLLALLLLPLACFGKVEHLLPKPKQVIVEKEVFLPAEFQDKITVRRVDSIAGAYYCPLEGFENEAYTLNVGPNGIEIKSVTAIGQLRARQTLAQLREGLEPGEAMQALQITDWPAFNIRGIMHDVGRSFIPADSLIRQLQLLAKFKVNVFHWHLTENQAWRFEVKAFPELNDANTMTRFAGEYYSQEDCRRVDSVARSCGITIIPEIDMPGHSAAFTRATSLDMQTPQAKEILKKVLDEVAEVFPNSPYIHIGGDEKIITDTIFLRQMTDHIHALGRKAICWNPIMRTKITADSGFDMTQMWGTAGKAVKGLPNIDCRYNYINHFDVFADVAAIYNSNIYYQPRGNEEVAGEITCIWNDRLTPTVDDIVRQNNMYASVLASAERAWMGGGEKYIEQGGAVMRPGEKSTEEFADWERRFIFHKAHSLKNESIPYVKQTDLVWTLYDETGEAIDTVCGATVYLNHVWRKVIPGALPPLDNGNRIITAKTTIYSPADTICGALIEFQNYSRSEKDMPPPQGQWDHRGSTITLNGQAIAPPVWTTPADAEITNETPLGNENLTARPPVPVKLRKGPNHVEVVLPETHPQGIRLNKWMFTFAVEN